MLNSRFSELEAIMAFEGGSIDLEIPSFRIKRSHKKSRLGCVNCKKRRVKCDEKQPSCDRCRFRRLTCVYAERANQATAAANVGSDPSSSKSTSASASPGSYASPESLYSPIAESWHVSGVSDTELLRHYLAHTVDTFAATSTRPVQTDIWRAVLPAVAYNSAAVRRGLLTLAAMDLHYHSPQDPLAGSKYLEVAEHHGEVFVRESRRQLREMQPSEIDSSIACSRLLCVLGLAFYHVHRRNGVTLSDDAAWTWLQLLRGVRPVNIAVMQTDQPVDPAFAEDLLPEIVSLEEMHAPPEGFLFMQCTHPLLEVVREAWPERLALLHQVLTENGERLTLSELGDLNTALVLLDTVTQHLLSGQMHSVFRTVVTWPGSVPKGFLDTLTGCSPTALALYAHWLVLVILLEDCWWLDNMGKNGIREICDMLSTEGPGIQMLLQWPRQIVHIDATMISPLDMSIGALSMQ